MMFFSFRIKLVSVKSVLLALSFLGINSLFGQNLKIIFDGLESSKDKIEYIEFGGKRLNNINDTLSLSLNDDSLMGEVFKIKLKGEILECNIGTMIIDNGRSCPNLELSFSIYKRNLFTKRKYRCILFKCSGENVLKNMERVN